MACGVYVLGVPLTILFILLRGRASGSIGTPAFDYRFGSLTLPFVKECWYWELLNTARKLAVVVVVQFLGRDATVESTLSQLMLSMSVFSVYVLAQVYVAPYTYVANNRLSLLTTVTLLFCLFSGLLYVNDQLGSVARDYTAVVTVGLIVVSLGVVMATVAAEYRRAAVRSASCQALGLNRYQLAAMEERLVLRMFPHAGTDLLASLLQKNEADRDDFLRDLMQLLAMVPSDGMNPFEALKAARSAAIGAGDRASTSLGSTVSPPSTPPLPPPPPGPPPPLLEAGRAKAGVAHRGRGVGMLRDARLLFTGRQVELVSMTANPLAGRGVAGGGR